MRSNGRFDARRFGYCSSDQMAQDYLQFCARQNKDPLDGGAVDEFLGR